MIELTLGMLLVLGLATRLAAALSAVLLVAFIGGIAWVWSHGYRIDCGCFGGGGELGVGKSPSYSLDILRDLTFLPLAGVLLADGEVGWRSTTGCAASPSCLMDRSLDERPTHRQPCRGRAAGRRIAPSPHPLGVPGRRGGAGGRRRRRVSPVRRWTG